jgi:hypothetical protein
MPPREPGERRPAPLENRSAGSGGTFARRGGPPARSGGPSARRGGPPARSGGPSARRGGPPARSGGPSARCGGPPARSGGPLARRGGPPARCGGPPARCGGPPARRGEPTARRGEPTARSGEPPASTGEPSARSGEPPADRGRLPVYGPASPRSLEISSRRRQGSRLSVRRAGLGGWGEAGSLKTRTAGGPGVQPPLRPKSARSRREGTIERICGDPWPGAAGHGSVGLLRGYLESSAATPIPARA